LPPPRYWRAVEAQSSEAADGILCVGSHGRARKPGASAGAEPAPARPLEARAPATRPRRPLGPRRALSAPIWPTRRRRRALARRGAAPAERTRPMCSPDVSGGRRRARRASLDKNGLNRVRALLGRASWQPSRRRLPRPERALGRTLGNLAPQASASQTEAFGGPRRALQSTPWAAGGLTQARHSQPASPLQPCAAGFRARLSPRRRVFVAGPRSQATARLPISRSDVPLHG